MDIETWAKFFGYSWKVLAVLAALTGLLNYHFGEKVKQKKEIENAKIGEIEKPKNNKNTNKQDKVLSEKNATLSDSIWLEKLNDPDNFFVEFGGNEQQFSKKVLESTNGINIGFGNLKLPVTFRMKDDIMLISTNVRSYDGKIVAELVDNKWILNPDNYFKKNHDSSAFEVVDNYGIVLLQVNYINHRTMVVNGAFLRNNNLVILNDEGMHYVGKIQSLEHYLSAGESIKPMFHYGKGNYGKRVN